MLAEMIGAQSMTGMVLMQPEDCQELLRLCTVMNWQPKLPLHIMRDASAGRWFLKGKPGGSDYWIRDVDIDILRLTPMWATVAVATPYGALVAKVKRELDEWSKPTATEIERRMAEGLAKMKQLHETYPVDKDDALDMYMALAKAARASGETPFTLIDDKDDPVEHEKQELAKARLAAEERLRKMDEWDDT